MIKLVVQEKYLLSGATYKSLKVVDDGHHTEENTETKWTAISDRVLIPLIEQLFTHIARFVLFANFCFY